MPIRAKRATMPIMTVSTMNIPKPMPALKMSPTSSQELSITDMEMSRIRAILIWFFIVRDI